MNYIERRFAAQELLRKSQEAQSSKTDPRNTDSVEKWAIQNANRLGVYNHIPKQILGGRWPK